MLFLLRLQAGLGLVWSCMGGCLHPKQPGAAAAGLPGAQVRQRVPQLVTSCSLLNVTGIRWQPWPLNLPCQGVLRLSFSPYKHNLGTM